MRIYVVRHAAAGQPGSYTNDEERPLTDKGVAQMRLVARGLAALEIDPRAVFSSPLVRARQTADILARALGKKTRVAEADVLAPGHAPAEVVEFLAEEDVDEIAIVGHEPQLGNVVSLMVAGSDEPVVDMKKAAVACVEFEGKVEPGQGCVAWHLVPSVIEALLAGKRK